MQINPTFEDKIKQIEEKHRQEHEGEECKIENFVDLYEQNEKQIYNVSDIRRTELFITNM